MIFPGILANGAIAPSTTAAVVRTSLGVATTDAVRFSTLTLGTTATAKLTIGDPTAGFKSFQAIQFVCDDATGGTDFGCSISTIAGENGTARQHSQMSWGYNPGGPNYVSSEFSFYQSIENFYRTASSINQLEYYFVYSNASGVGWRPHGITVNLDTDSAVVFFDAEAIQIFERATGTANISFETTGTATAIRISKTSYINFDGTPTYLVGHNGNPLIYPIIDDGSGGNLYRYAGGGSGVNNDVCFFAGSSIQAAHMLSLSVGQPGTTTNRSIRWNGTTQRWEHQTADSTWFAILGNQYFENTAAGVMRQSYGAGAYCDYTVGATGLLTIAPVGLKTGIGITPSNTSAYPALTVYDNLATGYQLRVEGGNQTGGGIALYTQTAGAGRRNYLFGTDLVEAGDIGFTRSTAAGGSPTGGTLTVRWNNAGVMINNGSIYPNTDDTYYLGKNDDDSPAAWKGVIVKDQGNGKYYRIEMVSGVLTATDLTD